MTIGEKIKMLREQREWSQEQLAIRMGYKSRSTINKIELNINELTQSRIFAFANIFGISPSELLDDEPLNMDEIKERWDDHAEQISKEVSLLDSIKDMYGEDAVTMLQAFMELNASGKAKAIENIQDLTDVPKYRKDENA